MVEQQESMFLIDLTIGEHIYHALLLQKSNILALKLPLGIDTL